MAKGSWDDGTTADKPVVLNGFEGDTLKLSAGQIPAVGSKPDAEYQAGSWDTVPSTDAAITGNKTFTYTYSPKGTISRTVTFYVVNGSWDDGTAESKSVTLTGKEGDALKLSADQIPAVGSKPDANYKEGSWNTVPDTTNLLTHLFGAEKRIGRRTVKKLRDALTHSVNQKAIDELIDREEELHGYMDQFLSKIREFDSAA